MTDTTTSANWAQMVSWANENWIVVIVVAVFLILLGLHQIEKRLADIFTLLNDEQTRRDVEEITRRTDAEMAQS